MNDEVAAKVHWSFWLTCAVMLIWNVMGCINFIMQMDPEMLAAYRESERAIIAGRPAWATAAFALGVFGGTFGCLLLLLRKSAAYYVFIASLFGVIATQAHTLSLGVDFGIGEVLGIVLMPIVVAAFLIGYSTWAERKRWVG